MNRLAAAAARLPGPVHTVRGPGMFTAQDLKRMGVRAITDLMVARLNEYVHLCDQFGAGWRPSRLIKDQQDGHSKSELLGIITTARDLRRLFRGELACYWNPRWETVRRKRRDGTAQPVRTYRRDTAAPEFVKEGRWITEGDFLRHGLHYIDPVTLDRANAWVRLCRQFGPELRCSVLVERFGPNGQDPELPYTAHELREIAGVAYRHRWLFTDPRYWNPRWETQLRASKPLPDQPIVAAPSGQAAMLERIEVLEQQMEDAASNRELLGVIERLQGVIDLSRQLTAVVDERLKHADAVANEAWQEGRRTSKHLYDAIDNGTKYKIQRERKVDGRMGNMEAMVKEAAIESGRRWRLNEYSRFQKLLRWWHQPAAVGVVRRRVVTLVGGVLTRFRAAAAAFRGPVEEAASPPKGALASASLAVRAEKIVRRYDIVDLIGRHVALERRGDLFDGDCPFCSHEVTVSPAGQSWHCVCGSGDVIEFVRLCRHTTYEEAMVFLERQLAS